MIGGRRPLQGRKIGDRRVRVDRPHSPYFRYTGAGMLTAKEAATAPRTGAALVWAHARRELFGRPLSTEDEAEERLPKKLALPIFSSDAISSSAYATEEILRVLVVAGAAAPGAGKRPLPPENSGSRSPAAHPVTRPAGPAGIALVRPTAR